MLGCLVAAWSLRTRRILDDIGVPRRAVNRALAGAAGLAATVGAAIGAAIGILVRPFLEHSMGSPLSPPRILWGPVLIDAVLTTASATLCSLLAGPVRARATTSATTRTAPPSTCHRRRWMIASALVATATVVTLAVSAEWYFVASLVALLLWWAAGIVAAPEILIAVAKHAEARSARLGPRTLAARIVLSTLNHRARQTRAFVASLSLIGAVFLLASGSVTSLQLTQGSLPPGMAMVSLTSANDNQTSRSAIDDLTSELKSRAAMAVAVDGSLASGGRRRTRRPCNNRGPRGPLTTQARRVLDQKGVICLARECEKTETWVISDTARDVPAATMLLPKFVYLPFAAVALDPGIEGPADERLTYWF